MTKEDSQNPTVEEPNHPVAETASPLADISQRLITLSQSSETPAELDAKKREFEAIYRELPDIADILIKFYSQLLIRNGLNPGEMKLYLVGGRVKGKPLRAESDLDLVFTVAQPTQALEMANSINGQGALDTMDTKIYLKKTIIDGLRRICEAKGLANHFHIIDFGTSSSSPNPDISLLIGEQKAA